MIRVLIAGGGTGGHLMPALALAEALVAEGRDVEPVLVGAQRGVEAELLPTRPYRHHLLPVEPIHRRRWWKNFKWPLILRRLLAEGARVLDDEKPALAVGTGGYAAGPILVQALKRGIPVALQEQNAFPGITTRRLARRARQIHLGFPEAKRHLRPGSTTEMFDYGNPIAPLPSPRPSRQDARAKLGIDPDARVLLVMGGSQGARSVNRVVAEALDDGLLEGVTLLWSTGPSTWEVHRRHDAPPNRQLKPFWDPIADAYAACDVAVARSGAMSTAELCAWELPSVLVPLPTAAGGHQTRNAEALARAGAAIHLPDPGITAQRLAGEVRDLLGDPERLTAMGLAAGSRGHPKAAEDIARQLLSLVS
jgi:UDP-N-acetylglucosamine--N-acetylmuramyl-(pentapeptide) pyrophosphoryl-undecaprenol N-acetylglucosamine transferase